MHMSKLDITKLDLLTPELFFELSISNRYMQNFERDWKSSFCIKVNNFAKSINFKILRECSQRKKLKLSKLEYYSL